MIKPLDVLLARDGSAATQDRIERVLHSAPMATLADTLARKNLVVRPEPIVCKYLDGGHLRLMFPVDGGKIELGSVASVVCLYDCERELTLYAHAMHVGPEVNPLLRHPDGPMAGPKSQSGADGDRATRRLIEHKRALWHRFLVERDSIGYEQAAERWREGYFWALQRLYYCTRCTPCRWGSPYFDGPDSSLPAKSAVHPQVPTPSQSLNGHAAMLQTVLASDAWAVEVAYAGRGGFRVHDHPRLLNRLDDGHVHMIFETDAQLIDGGSLIALSVTYDTHSQEVLFTHCLCAGPEPEIQFLRGEIALGLPTPQPEAAAAEARCTYAKWRRDAWTQFWLDELESGIATASMNWLRGFWNALERLFGGNDLSHTEPPFTSNDYVEYRTTLHETDGDAPGTVPMDSVLQIGGRCFVGHSGAHGESELRASGVTTLMVNLGRRCNLACHHCHIDAGPQRTEEMDRETVDMVLSALRRHRIETLDITGGAPEMNPHFRYLVEEASGRVSRIVDRCNLTILSEPGYEDLPAFLAGHRVEIAASLPWFDEDVDRQRGHGVFQISINGLQRLNELGYGQPGTDLTLNLVFNPLGTDLAPSEIDLECRYKRELSERFGIAFNHLWAMNNVPINRFRSELVRAGVLESYMESVFRAFNPRTLEGLMCRKTISVGWDGKLHDCDFNQALGIPVVAGAPHHIRNFDAALLQSRCINTQSHCFACAAGAGSSCSGALAPDWRTSHQQENHVESAVVGAEAR